MITKYLLRLKTWWMGLGNVERSFYIINTTTQIFLIIAPAIVIDMFADSWWEADPELFNVLVIPFFFGWFASLFAARWIISTALVKGALLVDNISNKNK